MGLELKKENLDKVFERFYQDEENDQQYYGGTGIGLEVVSTFIKYHKGKIEVESRGNVGTAMKVFFPAGKSHFNEKSEENNLREIKKLIQAMRIYLAMKI